MKNFLLFGIVSFFATGLAFAGAAKHEYKGVCGPGILDESGQQDTGTQNCRFLERSLQAEGTARVSVDLGLSHEQILALVHLTKRNHRGHVTVECAYISGNPHAGTNEEANTKSACLDYASAGANILITGTNRSEADIVDVINVAGASHVIIRPLGQSMDLSTMKKVAQDYPEVRFDMSNSSLPEVVEMLNVSFRASGAKQAMISERKKVKSTLGLSSGQIQGLKKEFGIDSDTAK